MKIIIYMPALNEADSIASVFANLPRSLEADHSIQYLVVDDGSVDNTALLAQRLGAFVISHGKNLGVGAAFQTAVWFALDNGADILVGIDADGQFAPREIPNLIESIITDKADMVVGNRFSLGIPESMPKLKYWGNLKVSQLIYYVCGQKLEDVSCGFRAYNKEALLRLNIFGNFTYTHETILSLAFQRLRIQEVPIHVKYDNLRKSRVAASLIRYAIQTSKIILRVLLDYRPMHVFGTLGAFFIFVSVLFEIFLLGHYIFTGAFTPYKSVGFIGLGFFVFGMLVLIIALIADMLNRIRLNQDKLLYEIKRNRYVKNETK